ncbi:MAG: hypothetical protein BGO55_10040 [Sphingobacteriales bacterium 50-39]|nr:hypothetical protein [Sphingobacteriales bacterium]OJW57879.1 MAG: hypothetical protein BGO55_10040 [Sphingobacteriales bacterium 50-39]
MKDVVSKDLSHLSEVKFNPLANYSFQVKPNWKTNFKQVSETSLKENIGLPLVGVNDDDPIYYSDDMGAFEYSKIISSAENRPWRVQSSGTDIFAI